MHGTPRAPFCTGGVDASVPSSDLHQRDMASVEIILVGLIEFDDGETLFRAQDKSYRMQQPHAHSLLHARLLLQYRFYSQ